VVSEDQKTGREIHGRLDRTSQSIGHRHAEEVRQNLASHWDGILAYYDYRISTGPLEGTNNKIKTMKRQAYGYRDNEFFKLKSWRFIWQSTH